MNKLIRSVLLLGVHLLTAVSVFLTAVVIVSPLVAVFAVIINLCQIELIKGLVLIAWLVVAFIVWIPLFIRVMIESHKNIK